MELGQRLIPQQRLELKPLLIQAVRLLPLTQLEIRHKLLQEYLQNPALELRDLEDIASIEKLQKPGREESGGDDDAWLQGLLFDRADELHPPYRSNAEPVADAHSRDWVWDRSISNPITLVDHLRWQIAMLTTDENIRETCYFLIEFLNATGFLEEEDDELARLAGIPVEQVKVARRVIVHLDPPGVGARNIRDSLLAQLEHTGHQDTTAYRLLSDAWEDLKKGEWDRSAEKLGVSRSALDEAISVIRQLEPRPARPFVPHHGLYIYPDVVVRKERDEYTIDVCRDLVPRFTISKQYVRLLRSGTLTPEEKQYLREKVLSARRLLRTLVYCESTLKRVARFIVQHQRAFLDDGLPGLRPLSLKDVAERLKLHESTISRTVQHKYIQTPRGSFEMRFFFQRKLRSFHQANGISTTVVRLRLKSLIEGEDPHQPYTDDRLARLLRMEGIQISRRAVSKYRREMNLPNARIRARSCTKKV